MSGIFEAAMLVCFAISWPFNLTRAYRARTNIGTSLFFMSLVFLGYLCGITNKVVNDDISYVLAFYLLDLGLVFMGLIIYGRNSRIDKKRLSGTQ